MGRCGGSQGAGTGSWAIGREVKALEGEQGQAEPSVTHTGRNRISSKWLNKDLSE